MAKSYSIAEARSSLPTIVDQAETGLDIELTRRGRPVAAVVSLRKLEQLRGGRPRFDETYRAFLRKYSLAKVGVERGFFETGRDRSTGRKVSL